MEYKYLNNYQKAEKYISWLNVTAIILKVVAFILLKQYFTYLMTLALVLLLISLLVVMHFTNADREEKRESVFYHLIGLYLILTICSLFTSAKAADYNSFSYVFIHSLMVGFLMLIAIQIIFKEKASLLASISGFVLVFALALFQINMLLNIILALVMGAVIFSALTKLMKPAGIYSVVFGIIVLVVSVLLLLKPSGKIEFYGHIIVNFAIVALFYVLQIMAKSKNLEIKETIIGTEEPVDTIEKEEMVTVEEEVKIEEKEALVATEEKTVDVKETPVNRAEKEKVNAEEKSEKISEEEVSKYKDLQNRNRWIIKKYNSLPLDELMKSPVDALRGVSANDAKLLKEAFNIKTVEDLATNKFFNWAKEIVEEAEKE